MATRSKTAGKGGKPRRRAASKALAVSGLVRQEAPASPALDRRLALVKALTAWSTMHLLLEQQAAFWRGFVEHADETPAIGKQRSRSRAKH